MSDLSAQLLEQTTSQDARLRKHALHVFQQLDVDGSGDLEPGEINEWLVSVCGWTGEQVQSRLWGRSGMWARVKSVGFESFLRAAVRFHWPIGNYDHAGEVQRISQQVKERHRAAAMQAVDLHVEVESACNLPAKDWLFSWSSDPYCKVSFNRQVRQTEPKYRTLEPRWGASFRFHIRDPAGSLSALVVQLYDHDFFTSDDDIGAATLSEDAMRSIIRSVCARQVAAGFWRYLRQRRELAVIS
jgi:hypothetical protein